MFIPSFSEKKNPLWPNRNDLRKVLDESDDSLGDVETTRSTSTTSTTVAPTTSKSTTVTTTKSTTTQRSTKRYYAPSKSPDDVPKTPKTYFSNSFYNNNNHNNINGQLDRSKSPKGVTQKTLGDTETPKPASAKPTINPFYYGFNRLPQYNTTKTTSTQKSPRLFTTTNRTPYSFQYFTTTKKLDLLTASTTQTTNYEVDNNYYENQSPPTVLVETEKPKSSTYNPVFDIYFKQIGRQRTTTKKSYAS
jgi:hypothetical protein